MDSADLAFIIPTRDRPGELARTLDRLGALAPTMLGRNPRVVVIDNASTPRAEAPTRLPNNVRVELIRSQANLGAAARNVGARACDAAWLVMLDDDSSPESCALAPTLREAPDDLAAVGGEIVLPTGAREAGGLPEVIIGCGCAIRRAPFLRLGGYDPAFDYYAEEYDLCARLIADGWRVAHTRRLRFEHRKAPLGRDFGRILARLVRNNAWVIHRYAPASGVDDAMRSMLARYERIASRERVDAAYAEAACEAVRTLPEQHRRPLSMSAWDRFIGAAAVRAALSAFDLAGRDVRLVGRGKGADVIERCVVAAGGHLCEAPNALDVIATLSPGPMLDAASRSPGALLPWCDALWSAEPAPALAG
ncbi:MAG: glycosyltransferase [Planctomycetota bacterium]